MSRPDTDDALSNAAFILSVNTDSIPVNARMVRALWEGVRELYRRDLLSTKMRLLRPEMHSARFNDVLKRIEKYRPWIDRKEYPQSTRVPSYVDPVRCELTDWLIGNDGLIMPVDVAIEHADDAIVHFADSMMALERHNAFKYNAIADRLYMEMADLISLAEVLINEGYHAENNLFKNFFGRVFARKGPGSTK